MGATTIVTDSPSTDGIIRAPNLRWEPLGKLIILAILSFYFLRRGNFIHRLLMHEGTKNEA